MTERQSNRLAVQNNKQVQARLVLRKNVKKIFNGTDNPKGFITYGELLDLTDYMIANDKDAYTITIAEVKSLIPKALAYKQLF